MQIIIWALFLTLILVLLFLDLGIFHRHARRISIREALIWTAIWVTIAMCFNGFIYFLYERSWLGWGEIQLHQMSGRDAAIQFLLGYLVEKSLSVDNIFVIAMIFGYFHIPDEQQHRVLFWGILGAVILRGAMIAVGASIIKRFEWATYLFGAILLVSAVKMLITREETVDPQKNLLVRIVQRVYPTVSNVPCDGAFFLRDSKGRLAVTHLFLSLVMVETTDVLFALDSIPAIFAVTRDSFLVFTSNIFAILGLRSLFFAVAGMMHQFEYLKVSLVFLLAFIGMKMMLQQHYEIPNLVSLAVIGGILFVGVAASIIAGRRKVISVPYAAEHGALNNAESGSSEDVEVV